MGHQCAAAHWCNAADPPCVELRFVLNPGMAFSLLSGKQLFLIIATSIALILVA